MILISCDIFCITTNFVTSQLQINPLNILVALLDSPGTKRATKAFGLKAFLVLVYPFTLHVVEIDMSHSFHASTLRGWFRLVSPREIRRRVSTTQRRESCILEELAFHCCHAYCSSHRCMIFLLHKSVGWTRTLPNFC